MSIFSYPVTSVLRNIANISAFIFTSVAVDFFQVRFPAREYLRHKAEKTHVDWHVINQSVMDL